MSIHAHLNTQVQAKKDGVTRKHVITIAIEDGHSAGAIALLTLAQTVELVTTLNALLDACREDSDA
jgi:hypothetical protein